MLQMHGSTGQNLLGVGNMTSINNAAMNATRTKMNSTMMVKFHSSTEKTIGVAGARSNLNKSTLLPSNIVCGAANRGDMMMNQINPNNMVNAGGNAGNGRTSNSTTAANANAQLKLNPNIVGNNGVTAVETNNLFDKNLQQNSLDHLNRSLNMHQIQAAFANNNNF